MVSWLKDYKLIISSGCLISGCLTVDSSYELNFTKITEKMYFENQALSRVSICANKNLKNWKHQRTVLNHVPRLNGHLLVLQQYRTYIWENRVFYSSWNSQNKPGWKVPGFFKNVFVVSNSTQAFLFLACDLIFPNGKDKWGPDDLFTRFFSSLMVFDL